MSLRDEVEPEEQYFQDGILSIDGLNRDLVECHSHVMWKRPQAYFALVREMELSMERFKVLWNDFKKDDLSDEEIAHRKTIYQLHRSMIARMEFYRVKLKGLENYIYTTLERLKVQREAVRNAPCFNSLFYSILVNVCSLEIFTDKTFFFPTALQYHVSARSATQPRNCRRAASDRTCKQAGQHGHEDHFSDGCALLAGHLPRLCL